MSFQFDLQTGKYPSKYFTADFNNELKQCQQKGGKYPNNLFMWENPDKNCEFNNQ